MEGKLSLYLSKKRVKSLAECVGERLFIIPKSRANEIDIVTGEPCVFVQINGTAFYLPVDRPAPVSYNAFCVLRDIGMLSHYNAYEEGEVFNPL